MEIFLQFGGDPGFQSGIAEHIGVHITSASQTVNCVMNQIVEDNSGFITEFVSRHQFKKVLMQNFVDNNVLLCLL